MVISFLVGASVIMLAKSYNFMHVVLQIFEKYVKNWIAIAAPFQGK
jgi:ATP-dependent Clp protease adapter protein ClpS